MSWFQTCDITTTLYAHPPAEPAGCLRPLYFFFFSFHDNTVERLRREERLDVFQQEALHRLR